MCSIQTIDIRKCSGIYRHALDLHLHLHLLVHRRTVFTFVIIVVFFVIVVLVVHREAVVDDPVDRALKVRAVVVRRELQSHTQKHSGVSQDARDRQQVHT